MKKKISLLLCVLLTVCCFVGCSNKDATLSDEQKQTMQMHSDIMLQLCMDPETLIGIAKEDLYEAVDSYSEFEMNNFIMSLNNYFAQYGIAGMKINADEFRSMFDAWEAAVDECGEFKELGEFKVNEEELTVSVKAKFAEREATVSFAFDDDYGMESMDVSADYSLREILTKSGLNTVLGMGTVFVVLIFLAFLISLMKYIPDFVEQFKGEREEKQEQAPVEKKVQEPKPIVLPVTEPMADLELVAVITAAIAAQEGTGTDGFVVRSIRRRPLNNWN